MVEARNSTVEVGDKNNNNKNMVEIRTYLKPSWVLASTKKRVNRFIHQYNFKIFKMLNDKLLTSPKYIEHQLLSSSA